MLFLVLNTCAEVRKADELQRTDEVDRMRASTGGFLIFIRFGTTTICDFKWGCDGDLPGVAIVVP